MDTALSPTLNASRFSSVFTEVPHAQKTSLSNPCELHLYHLAVASNRFVYEDLKDFLKLNLGRYVNSRARLEQYKVDGAIEMVVFNAAKLIRQKQQHSRLLGEMLLYAMLEYCLGAPKILSKIELDTAGGFQRSLCDGIHLLDANPLIPPSIVFGASEVYPTITDAIDEGISRITAINSNMGNECRLVEAVSLATPTHPEEARRIRDLLIPIKGGQPRYERDYALFLGYNLGLLQNYPTHTYLDQVEKKMELDIRKHASYIAQKIISNQLDNHSFHIYFLPFNDVDTDTGTIFDALVGA